MNTNLLEAELNIIRSRAQSTEEDFLDSRRAVELFWDGGRRRETRRVNQAKLLINQIQTKPDFNPFATDTKDQKPLWRDLSPGEIVDLAFLARGKTLDEPKSSFSSNLWEKANA